MDSESGDEWWPVDGYGPVSIGAQVVGDRWTLLIARELLEGTKGFNELHRGLPGLSRSLLAARLRRLEGLGLVRRLALGRRGTPVDYLLTPAGLGLADVIQALGTWTRDWHLPAAGPAADSPTALWRLFKTLDTSALPQRGVSIAFNFRGGTPSRGWIRADRVRPPQAGLSHPEGDVDMLITVAPDVLDDLTLGVRACDPAIEAGDIVFEGAATLTRAYRSWFATPSPVGDGR